MAEDINIKYKVKAEILTPLNIGQGAEKDWVEGIDFIVKDKVLCHLDMTKMVDAGVDIARLSACFASGKAKDIAQLIGSRLESVSDFQMSMPCSTENPIKTFYRNQLTNRPVLVGSSLKGAIRSILFSHFRDSKVKKERKNEDVFGSMKEGNDFMRFIRVGDMEFESTKLINTKIFNLQGYNDNWEGGWKHTLKDGTNSTYSPIGFNTIYECLFPGAKADGSIMLAKVLFEKLHEMPYKEKKKELVLAKHPNKILCQIINDHTFDYLDKEYTFFEQYDQANRSTEILNGIADLQDMINNCEANECILKMSAGVGFHSITGDWQFEDYTDTGYYPDTDRRNAGKKKYKSRKIATYGTHFSLMGFVKLTFEE